jgi:hypothetical protein
VIPAAHFEFEAAFEIEVLESWVGAPEVLATVDEKVEPLWIERWITEGLRLHNDMVPPPVSPSRKPLVAERGRMRGRCAIAVA